MHFPVFLNIIFPGLGTFASGKRKLGGIQAAVTLLLIFIGMILNYSRQELAFRLSMGLGTGIEWAFFASCLANLLWAMQSIAPRTVPLFLNFMIPGTGSFLLGKWRVGLAQIAILAVSLIAMATSFHTFFAVCAIAAVWFWGLYTAEWSPHTGSVAEREQA